MRTRFAPSPTGHLHVGGLRTALYAYLLAKQNKGKFLLRIEDTDREREVAGAVEQILHSLAWAGISPDEGVALRDGLASQVGDKGPYVQSERLDMYKQYATQLLEQGHAYHCFCTPERLDEMRKKQQERKQAPMYDRQCLSLGKEEIATRLEAGERHVLRMKIPHDRTIAFNDEVRGEVSFKGHTIDDQVLMKGDGFPTYHLAHVVDDKLMEIDAVIRGEEWLSSLPKHLLLWEWFGWEPPKYAHLPLLLNADRTKLSKRQGDVSVSEYSGKGYLPEAMLNFIALLGWNPGTTQDIFSLQELIEQFSLERVQKAGAVFDPAKLEWLQGQWMRKIPAAEFAERIKPLVAGKYPAAAKDTDFAQRAALIQERITFFLEAPEMLSYYYEEPRPTVELMANPKQKVTPEMLPEILDALETAIDAIAEQDWNDKKLEEVLRALTTEKGWKLGQTLWPLRAALTGREFSPGAFEVAAALGKEETIKRLKIARQLATDA